VDVFAAVKSSYNLFKKAYVVVALLVDRFFISEFRCATRGGERMDISGVSCWKRKARKTSDWGKSKTSKKPKKE
jgi:hypothetical protein